MKWILRGLNPFCQGSGKAAKIRLTVAVSKEAATFICYGLFGVADPQIHSPSGAVMSDSVAPVLRVPAGSNSNI